MKKQDTGVLSTRGLRVGDVIGLTYTETPTVPGEDTEIKTFFSPIYKIEVVPEDSTITDEDALETVGNCAAVTASTAANTYISTALVGGMTLDTLTVTDPVPSFETGLFAETYEITAVVERDASDVVEKVTLEYWQAGKKATTLASMVIYEPAASITATNDTFALYGWLEAEFNDIDTAVNGQTWQIAVTAKYDTPVIKISGKFESSFDETYIMAD